MSYQIPKALIPKITSVQDRLKALGVFNDKVNGNPGLTTWEAIEYVLTKAKNHGVFETASNSPLP